MSRSFRPLILSSFILALPMVLAISCSNSNDQVESTSTVHPVPKRSLLPAFYEVIDRIGQPADSGPDDLYEQMEIRIKNDQTNIWLRLNLAYVYQGQRNYRRALNHYLIAESQASDLADPLIGLGRLCYDLALIDMVQRSLVTTGESGLVQFFPDEHARRMLEEARALLLESKTRKQLSKQQGGMTMTVSPPGTADKFIRMIDAKLKRW